MRLLILTLLLCSCNIVEKEPVDISHTILEWMAPETNEDGTPLKDLDSYIVGVFDKDLIYESNPKPVHLIVVDKETTLISLSDLFKNFKLDKTRYLIALKAIDSHGNTSKWSDFVSVSILN